VTPAATTSLTECGAPDAHGSASELQLTAAQTSIDASEYFCRALAEGASGALARQAVALDRLGESARLNVVQPTREGRTD
jgi:hypothetical protein